MLLCYSRKELEAVRLLFRPRHPEGNLTPQTSSPDVAAAPRRAERPRSPDPPGPRKPRAPKHQRAEDGSYTCMCAYACTYIYIYIHTHVFVYPLAFPPDPDPAHPAARSAQKLAREALGPRRDRGRPEVWKQAGYVCMYEYVREIWIVYIYIYI